VRFASRAHAHHDDYGLPLKVRWLCRNHTPNGTDTMSQSSVMKAPKGWTDQIQISATEEQQAGLQALCCYARTNQCSGTRRN